MEANLRYFNGRITTSLDFYPIFYIENKKYKALKWKSLSGDKILVLEKKHGLTDRSTERHKLRGQVTNTTEFITTEE
jgi:hypothetical protein